LELEKTHRTFAGLALKVIRSAPDRLNPVFRAPNRQIFIFADLQYSKASMKRLSVALWIIIATSNILLFDIVFSG
jgi:hypothetical protein